MGSLTQSINGGYLMNRVIRIVCLCLVFSVILAIPVAAEEIAPYASSFFGSHSTYLRGTSSTSFQVCFTVTGVSLMSEIGVDYIDIERSSDGVNWSVVKTYDHDDYSSLLDYNSVSHSGYVTYTNRQSGYQYRAYVDFYAKNSSGTASYGAYAYF